MNILVAEDEPDIAMQYKSVLADRRHRVVVTYDGDQCLQAFYAELDKVQFSEVIDIAAHVQEVSPENGIALSDAVARELQMDGLSELPGLVDGQRVLTVVAAVEIS